MPKEKRAVYGPSRCLRHTGESDPLLVNAQADAQSGVC
jgi:hypothetical protein